MAGKVRPIDNVPGTSIPRSFTIMSRLAQEVDEIPARIGPALAAAQPHARAVASSWAKLPGGLPAAIFTIARGTSDAAASYIGHRISMLSRIPVGSFTPSLASLQGYQCPSPMVAALAISQSGASPDLCTAFKAFPANSRISITNVPSSPLAAAAKHKIPLNAGVEHSVAATKTFVCSLVVGEALALALGGQKPPDANLLSATTHTALSQPIPLANFAAASSIYVLGRGSTLPLAMEAALKLKELAGLHAEAVSAAEVMHGPKALVSKKIPVLYFAGPGEAGAQVLAAVKTLGQLGSPSAGLTAAPDEDILGSAVRMICSFYRAVVPFAREAGADPDKPHALRKVTLTR